MQLAFQPFLLEDNHDFGLQYTISQLPLLTPIMFKCSTWSFMMAINRVTTTVVNGILSCLHSNAHFILGKSLKIRLFPKHLSSRLGVLNSSLLFAFSLHVWKVTQRCGCCEFEFCVMGRTVSHHRHIAFLSVIEDAPLLTKTVKINQSEGIPGSGIPERTFVKNSYKNSRTSLPNPPLLFIAFFTSHRSPLSKRLEQAIQVKACREG